MFSTRLISLYDGIKRLPIRFAEALLSFYFCYCNLTSCTVDLDDDCQTSMHIWVPNHRSRNKPNLVLLHGYGGNSKWQFVLQVAELTRRFNVYIPDLVFFGKSYSTTSERTDMFQARCVCDAMKKVGVEKFSVYGMSYGGFVAYWMAEMEEERVEKVVIVSSGIVFSEKQKSEMLKDVGCSLVDVLVPEKPEEMRTLCRMTMHKFDVGKLFPDFFLRGFIEEADGYKKEKQQLLEYLLMEKPHLNLPVLSQETLIIWGEKDKIFPVQLAHQLHRHLGLRSQLEILKDVGHATNMEAPNALNKLATLFLSPTNVDDVY